MYRLLLCLVMVLLAATPAWAAEAGQVSVPLQGDQPRGDEARQAALRQGLETVITRLTGRDRVAELPGVAEALADPRRWLSRYSYEAGEPPRLSALFDDRALTRYLADHGAPVWGGSQPPVLVWLVTEGTGRGDLVTGGDPLARRLEQVAERRGLSLVLPEGDQRDRDTVTVADVRGRFDGPVLQASRRYDTAWVATAVLYDGAASTLNWRLLHDGEAVAGERARADGTDAALDDFIAALSDQMAERYAVGGDEPESTAPDTAGGDILLRDDRVITVRGVDTLGAWHRLYQELADLGPVRKVALRVVSDDRVQFELAFSGDRAELARLVASLDAVRDCGDPTAPPLTYCLR
ncbi:DUF2066 domain-containing protein [Alloalcanivorax sp. C16-2]|uniref:DUF2066 domain-containing protein n=1 Tax=Alloalcanivorax sp. C16-2 TaxID=3390052 RepID=UPI003970F4A8